jgi:hypothetical protein
MSISAQKHSTDRDPKARFRSARPRPDFTIDQNWSAYSPAEHNRGNRLFKQSHAVLRDRACGEFLAMMEKLELSQSGIPDMKKLSSRLAKLTGWRVVPVLELVPDAVFFDLLIAAREGLGITEYCNGVDLHSGELSGDLARTLNASFRSARPARRGGELGMCGRSLYGNREVSRSTNSERTRAAQQRASLFDHLVGASEQGERHGDAERLRPLQVDNQLDLGRLLHRQVGTFSPFKMRPVSTPRPTVAAISARRRACSVSNRSSIA